MKKMQARLDELENPKTFPVLDLAKMLPKNH
jgi:hypothetical protein